MTHDTDTHFICIGTMRTSASAKQPNNNVNLIERLQEMEQYHPVKLVICSNKSATDVGRYLQANRLRPTWTYSAQQDNNRYVNGIGSSQHRLVESQFWDNMQLINPKKTSEIIKPSPDRMIYLYDDERALSAFKDAKGAMGISLAQQDVDILAQIKGFVQESQTKQQPTISFA